MKIDDFMLNFYIRRLDFPKPVFTQKGKEKFQAYLISL